MFRQVTYNLTLQWHTVYGLCIENMFDYYLLDQTFKFKCKALRSEKIQFPECIECMCQSMEVLSEKSSLL